MTNIQQRPNGKWRARYRDDDGREHAKHFDRKREAQAWLDSITTAIRTNTYVDPRESRTTLAAFYAEWAPRQVWAMNTRRAADRAIETCTFKDVPFGKLRRSHAEQWIKAMSAELAPTTLRMRVAYVRIPIGAAVTDRLLAADPTVGLRLPKARRIQHAMVVPTPEEIAAIRKHAEPFLHPLLDVMAFAGLRIGEASAVQVTDVNFLRRELHVERQVQPRRGAIDVTPPKHGSERVIPVPDGLLSRLSQHISETGTFGDEDWLLPGSPPSPGALRNWFNRARTAAGVNSAITPHTYRHYYASGMIRAGLDAVSVSKAMGHASPSITLQVYAHLFPDASDRMRTAAADLYAATEDSADHLRTIGS